VLVVVGVGSLLVEVWGVHTGTPFGRYAYTGHLGPRLAGVPLVVPLAWSMMAWPALCVARRVTRSIAGHCAVAALALASWDLLLDPQMVAAGNWRWSAQSPALQGIPLHNFVGWLVCAAVLMTVLERLCPPTDQDSLPVGLWVWTWLGSVVADAVFLGLPGTALAGGLGMALVGVPLLARSAPTVRRLAPA
jgi:uncharacterized membrane protein